MQHQDPKLTKLYRGANVTVSYYCDYAQEYFHLTGTVEEIESFWQLIQIEKCLIGFNEIDKISFHERQ